ncbi:MAG: tetratricopeptide repeat protein, partial [Bacteroidota bacterium]
MPFANVLSSKSIQALFIHLVALNLLLIPTSCGKGFSNYLRRGHQLAQRGKHAQAIRAYDAALAKKPQAISALYYRAGSRYLSTDYEGAMRDFNTLLNQANTSNKKKGQALVGIGKCKEKLGKFEEAIRAYEQSLFYYPRNAYAFYNRGMSHHYLKDYEKAILDYGK